MRGPDVFQVNFLPFLVCSDGILREIDVYPARDGVGPFSTAFLASNPAPIMTDGFDVFVQLVIAAITTAPSSIFSWWLLTLTSADFWPSERLLRKLERTSWSSIRSCGRRGPAKEGT